MGVLRGSECGRERVCIRDGPTIRDVFGEEEPTPRLPCDKQFHPLEGCSYGPTGREQTPKHLAKLLAEITYPQ